MEKRILPDRRQDKKQIDKDNRFHYRRIADIKHLKQHYTMVSIALVAMVSFSIAYCICCLINP